MYLRDSNMPIDLTFEPKTSQYMDNEDYLVVLKERMLEAWPKANLTIKYRQEQMKEAYDKNTKEHNFKMGDKIMLENKACLKEKSPKLTRTFKGPYRVEKVTDTNLVIKLITTKKAEPIWVHANRCKAFEEPREQGEVTTSDEPPKESKKKGKQSANTTGNRYSLRSKAI